VDPEHVAAAICGAHGQVMSAAELSIGMRLESGTRTAVRAALWQERTLVKTFGPRGTVHLLRSADLPLWLGALSAIPALSAIGRVVAPGALLALLLAAVFSRALASAPRKNSM